MYAPRTDLDIFDDIMESKFIEIDKEVINQKRNVIIGVTYPPPNGNVEQFPLQLSGILNQIKSENKMCYLLGDYDINLFTFLQSRFIDVPRKKYVCTTCTQGTFHRK